MIKVPGYIIKNEIGTGGMATVYLAVQTSLERKVALKVMAPALSADQAFSKRFLGEARTIARLNHPNIVPIYEVGVTDTYLHYFSMQHLPDGDLADRVEAGLDETDLVAILKGICGALGFAHEQGFIHRDVTPGNILFDKSGTPVLTDFGIARAVSQATRITGTGVSVGTSHYMSPEQARGGDVDPRSDLYSLGALTFEALAGRPPYEGADGFAIAYAHVFDPIPKLPSEHAHWQDLIETAMAKDPADRFDDSKAFAAALDLVLNKDRVVADASASTVNNAGDAASTGDSGSQRAPWKVAIGQAGASGKHLLRQLREKALALPLRGRLLFGLGAVAVVAAGLIMIVGQSDQPAAIVTDQTAPEAAPPVVPQEERIAQVQDGPDTSEPPRDSAIDKPIEVPQPERDSLVLLDLKSGRKVAGAGTIDSDDDTEPAPDVRAITDLLRIASSDVTRNRLMTPPGDNAFERYMEVLNLDPGNPTAESGLGKIVEAYQDLADTAIRDNNYRLAATFLKRAERVAVSTPATAAM